MMKTVAVHWGNGLRRFLCSGKFLDGMKRKPFVDLEEKFFEGSANGFDGWGYMVRSGRTTCCSRRFRCLSATRRKTVVETMEAMMSAPGSA